MKEPPAVIQLVQAKCIELNQHPFTKKKVRTLGQPAPLSKPVAAKALPQQVNEQQRPLLPFPITSSVRVLRQRTIEGLRRIESQAERINQLSAELETAVLELKEIASEVNRDWRAFQAIQQPTIGAIAKQDTSPSFASNICE